MLLNIATAENDSYCHFVQEEYQQEIGKAGLSAQERAIVDHFAAEEKATISAGDVLEVQPVQRATANQILSRLHRKGWLRRVKRGVYVLVPLGSAGPRPALEQPWLLAMRLFAPCYISGWSAAEHWDLTEQIFNAVAVVTAHPQRAAEQTFAGVRFRTRAVSEDKIFGTRTVWLDSHRVAVADPHRLIIDILDSPELGGGARHTLDVVRAYWGSAHADPSRLMEYAKRFDRGSVFKRLGFTSELIGAVSGDWLAECERHTSPGISKLDPSTPAKGQIAHRWKLRVNVPVDSP